MKKLFAIFVCAVLISGAMVTAYAQTALAGTTWELFAISEDGTSRDASGVTLEFKGNGIMVMTTSEGSSEVPYTQDGETVNINNGELHGLVRDNLLAIVIGGETYVFQLTSGSPSGGSDGGQQPDQPSGDSGDDSGRQPSQPSGNSDGETSATYGIVNIFGSILGLLIRYWYIVLGTVVGLIIVASRSKKSKAAPPSVAGASAAYIPPASPPVAPQPVQPMATPPHQPMIPITPVPSPMPVQQPAAATASSHLICTKGHYAGATFPINGYMFIGRDPKQCQLVFPNETKGISSLHCEVRQQGNSVVLSDKGSTYGTFVKGRKLNSNENVTLNPGDSFHLADGGNEFKIL